MKLYTGLVAFLPEPNSELMELTNRSVLSTMQFSTLGPVQAYHADLAEPKPDNCSKVHSVFADMAIKEHRGPLMDNWRVLIEEGFDRQGADWVLFVSNDVIWRPGAAESIGEQLEKEDWMTYSVMDPTACFLLSRGLFERMKPNAFWGYHTADKEDDDFAMQAVAAGGVYKRGGIFDGLAVHESRATTRFLPQHAPSSKTKLFLENTDTFHKRWPLSSWPPDRLSQEELLYLRQNPKRPYP